MDPIDVIRLWRAVVNAIKRIAQASGATHDAAVDLADALEKLEPELARALAAPRPPSARAVPSLLVAKLLVALARILPAPDNPSPKQWYKWYPDVSANVIDIKRQGDGSAMVSIDGKKLRVPPALADLVSELIVDDGSSSPDDLIPFKPLPVLALKLKKSNGRDGIQALNQLIYRLRRLLGQHGFPPFLVQTNRRAGARLALRRQEPAQAAQSPLA